MPRPLLKFLIIPWLVCLVAATEGQSDRPRPSTLPTPKIAPANRWRDTPVSLTDQVDSVSPAVRKARDKFWDLRFPPLPKGVLAYYGKGGTVNPNPIPWSEVKEMSKGSARYPWVIGEFDSYHVFQTSRGGGVYTEINLSIRKVFRTKAAVDANLAVGQTIDLTLRGGSVVAADGTRVNFLLHDDDPGMQPGHLYLIQVIPCDKSNLLCAGTSIYYPGRKWDLTSGTVVAVDRFDLRMQAEGRSSISGSDTTTIAERFQKILSSVDNE